MEGTITGYFLPHSLFSLHRDAALAVTVVSQVWWGVQRLFHGSSYFPLRDSSCSDQDLMI